MSVAESEEHALRLRFLQVTVPLSILCFLSTRLVHADEWLTTRGFRVPDLGGDWRQPLYLPPLPAWAAWTVAAAIIASGIALALGRARPYAGLAFAALTAYVALADRLEAFTVSKLAPVLAFALVFARRGGSARFFQWLLVVFYCGSGIAKARGDWLTADVLYSHLHDDYQTQVTWWLVRTLPGFGFRAIQLATLAFEVGAPLWFGLRRTRGVALLAGLTMHALIGVMFGPVLWFSILMISLLFGAFGPLSLLVRVTEPLRRLVH
jgi:hypothetical protein